jgi:ABC-type nitrate/sulfonate/bicarbonate transport system substrate-binding protein
LSATAGKIREDPAEVAKMVRAVIRANRFMVDPRNKDEVVTYIAENFRLDRNSSVEVYQWLSRAIPPTGTVELDKIKLVIDAAVERGVTDKAIGPDMTVDFSFAKKVVRDLGS